MSELDRLQDAFLKADKLAQEGDEQAAEDARLFASEIRRLQAGGQTSEAETFMGRVNRGIANTVGGAVDVLNPFDNPAWADIAGGRFQTGSAVTGLERGMEAIGADIAPNTQPEGIMSGFAQGVGNAAGALPAIAGGAGLLRGVGGAIGGAAGEAQAALASVPGLLTELFAGGLGGGAGVVAEAAGAPPWARSAAEIAAPALGIPAAIGAARGFKQGVSNLPLVSTVGRVGREVRRALTPMTDAGAREVARARLQELSGGAERAMELAGRIGPDDALRRTPAQQTGDELLLGLERAARGESPTLNERLTARDAATRDAARAELEALGGNVEDARKYFDGLLRSFRADMKQRVDDAISMGGESIEAAGPRVSETSASLSMVERVRGALAENLERERELWSAVPREALVPTKGAAGIAQSLKDELPRAQAGDFPDVARRLLLEEGGLGPETNVNELHGLYSELRRIARAASSGQAPNRNMARIANEIAEAILDDLGAIDAKTPAGRAINEARAFSRALAETFDQGTVGRMLKRTVEGGEAMTPEAAMARTVGRGGAEAVSASQGIRAAAPDASEDVAEYLRGRFLDSAFAGDGKFTPRSAETWFRQNRELLNEYPELRTELRRAFSSRENAEAFAVRTEARVKAIETQSSIAGFNRGQDTQAVSSILNAADPVRTARAIANAAARDESGQALAGVKGAFTDFLIGNASTNAGLAGPKLDVLVNDPKMAAALRQVFSAEEVKRLQWVARELAKVDAPRRDVGEVLDSSPNRLVEYVVRIVAARTGGQMGGGSMGGSLQTANIVQERARDMLRNLTNDKARQLLMDAVEDPKLFRVLLMEPASIALSRDAQNTLSRYLAGGAAAGLTPEEEGAR